MEKLHTTSKIKKALMVAGATMALGGALLTTNTIQAEASSWDERPLTEIQLDIQEVKESESIEYQIQWGDTLGNIAKALDMDLHTLANANGIGNIDVIIAGQYLVISEDAQGQTQVEVNEESSKPVTPQVTEVKSAPVEQAKPEPKPEPVAKASTTSTNGYMSAREAFDLVVAEKGVSQSEANHWADLINRESSWNPAATNPSSKAYGLPQSLPASKMASHGDIHDPVVQLRWMHDYVKGANGSGGRYGSFANAIAHHNAKNWY